MSNREFGFYFFLRFTTAGGALAALMILKLWLVWDFFGYGSNIAVRMEKNERTEPVICEGYLR